MEEQKRNGCALIGFMEEQDAINFLKSCILSASDDEIREFWRKAKSEVDSLSIPDLTPEIIEIEDTFKEQLDTVSKNPLFLEAVQQRKWEFKFIEIDKLVCFQKYVDTDYSDEIAKEYDFSNTSELIDFCLPEKPLKRPMGIAFAPQEHSYTIFSSSPDLRIIGLMQNQDPINKRQSFGFLVGWGVPYIQVIKFKDRYFLKNGYHRTYVLRKNGIRYLPCILSESENFIDTGAVNPGFFSQELLMSNKPPIFANFFSDNFSPNLQMRHMTKIVRVKAEEYVLPGMVQFPPAIKEEKIAVPALTKEIKTAFEETDYEDFRVEKEDWNIYKLSDGTILKVRQVLLKLKKETSTDSTQPNFSIQTSNLLLAVIPPSNLKGSPSTQQYDPHELNASIIENNMKYETIQDVANEYVTKSGIKIVFQVVSLNVAKTNKFDASGEPIYLVNAQNNIQVIPIALNG